MSDNIEAICDATKDPCAETFVESAATPLPVQSDVDIGITPVAVSLSDGDHGQKIPSAISEARQLEKEGNDIPTSENETKTHNNKELNGVAKLEMEIQKRTHERDNYKKKLADTEKKLATLQASYAAVTNGDGDEITLRREKEELRNTLTQTRLMLDDRGRLVANQQTQIAALSKQVSSLKEVVAITKDLLNIRNMEVKHLQNDVDAMEGKITAERDRHNAMMTRMDAAVRLNADLKKEYETQLNLFQDLRGKYEQKVTLLSEENRALEAANQSAAL